MNRFSELKKLVEEFQDDFTKFYDKDNQAAGTRVRKGMQDLKDLAQSIREQVQDLKNEKDKK
jgi:vacuolar-type H+-ATPase catalytic subunit A/Vma1